MMLFTLLLALAGDPIRVRVINNAPCAAAVEVSVRDQIVRTIRVEAMSTTEQRIADVPMDEELRYRVRPTSRGCHWEAYPILTPTVGLRDIDIHLHDHTLLTRIMRRSK